MIRRTFGVAAGLVVPALAAACSVAMRGPSRARDFAYAYSHDSLTVAVSTSGRTDDEVQDALRRAVLRAAEEERCEPTTLSRRGDRDPRLSADALAYLKPPHLVAVAACVRAPAR
jgi:hypothetical protein